MPKWKSLFNTFLGLLKIWSLHFFRNLSLCPTPPFWSPTILNCHRHHPHPHCHPHHRRLAQCQRPEIHIPSFGSTPCPCWWVWCPSWWVTNDALIWNVVLVTLDPPTAHPPTPAQAPQLWHLCIPGIHCSSECLGKR